MNPYMRTYIEGAVAYLKTFEQSLRMAALEDDGRIDKQEQKIIDRTKKLTDKYVKGLEKLIE